MADNETAEEVSLSASLAGGTTNVVLVVEEGVDRAVTSSSRSISTGFVVVGIATVVVVAPVRSKETAASTRWPSSARNPNSTRTTSP